MQWEWILFTFLNTILFSFFVLVFLTELKIRKLKNHLKNTSIKLMLQISNTVLIIIYVFFSNNWWIFFVFVIILR